VIHPTLDEEEIVAWAQEQGSPRTSPHWPRAEVHELIQAELDRANANYAQVEQVKKFAILDHDSPRRPAS
jgi:long-chain acyl-CoA synthetase